MKDKDLKKETKKKTQSEEQKTKQNDTTIKKNKKKPFKQQNTLTVGPEALPPKWVAGHRHRHEAHERHQHIKTQRNKWVERRGGGRSEGRRGREGWEVGIRGGGGGGGGGRRRRDG